MIEKEIRKSTQNFREYIARFLQQIRLFFRIKQPQKSTIEHYHNNQEPSEASDNIELNQGNHGLTFSEAVSKGHHKANEEVFLTRITLEKIERKLKITIYKTNVKEGDEESNVGFEAMHNSGDFDLKTENCDDVQPKIANFKNGSSSKGKTEIREHRKRSNSFNTEQNIKFTKNGRYKMAASSSRIESKSQECINAVNCKPNTYEQVCTNKSSEFITYDKPHAA